MVGADEICVGGLVGDCVWAVNGAMEGIDVASIDGADIGGAIGALLTG